MNLFKLSNRQLQQVGLRATVWFALGLVAAADLYLLRSDVKLTAAGLDRLFLEHVLLSLAVLAEQGHRAERAMRVRSLQDDVPALIAMLECDLVPMLLVALASVLLILHAAPNVVLLGTAGLLAGFLEWRPRAIAKLDAV